MAERRFPRPDADFAASMADYAEALKAWWSAQGLDDTQLKPFQLALDDWAKAFEAHVAAQAAAHAATAAKDRARVALQAAARPLTRFVQSYPTTTNADRATLGITIRDARNTPNPAPTSRPLVHVDAAARLTHEIRVTDLATPTSRARPARVARAEIFVALTAPTAPAPVVPDAYRYVGSLTGGTTTLRFEPARGGMQAHYLARWVANRGGSGPWSDAASATVAA